MEYPALVTLSAVAATFKFSADVGAARGKYNVQPPATTGNPIFERYYRVHMNTVEQAVLFFPALWVSAYFFHPKWASVLGALWVLSRILYARAYVEDPKKRLFAMAGTAISLVLLLLSGFVGAGYKAYFHKSLAVPWW